MTITAAAPTIPSVRDVRVRLRRARRAHSDRTLGELLTDVYLVGFVLVLYGGSGAVALRRHLAKPVAGPIGLESTRAWLVIALLVAVVTLAWREEANSLLVLPLTYIPPLVLGGVLVRAIRADRRSAPDADGAARA